MLLGLRAVRTIILSYRYLRIPVVVTLTITYEALLLSLSVRFLLFFEGKMRRYWCDQT